MAQSDGRMFPNELIRMWLNKQSNAGLNSDATSSSAANAPTVYPQPKYDADLVCLSHLRWDFVYQRPQHLLSRAARGGRVFFVEEPLFDKGSMRLDITERDCGVKVVVPILPEGLRSEIAREAALQQMMNHLFRSEAIREYVLWYYTPMALEFTRHLRPAVTVYDCMDELSAFKGAPTRLGELEQELFARADMVFTGGRSLYESKRAQHKSVHCFPSSIDRQHFLQARSLSAENEPSDQSEIAHPRLGFYGVVDERFDAALLDSVATARPDWQFVIVGPVVKIDPASLPQLANIHYLGPKTYNELPAYLAGWDVALLLFARNDSTRFISPTKTPEYLAAGKPVVSTSIRDVVQPYGEQRLVEIADTPADFISAVERLLGQQNRESWLAKVDGFLAAMSWDVTWSQMWNLISEVGISRRRKESVKAAEVVIQNQEPGRTTAAGAV